MQAAKKAEDNYLTEAKKVPQGAARRFFRLMGDYSSAANPWMRLLPNDKYFSTLCEGLKLIFEVTANRRDRREQVLVAFNNLLLTILKTQRCYELFPDNPVLRDRALAVYLDLLDMIEGIIACPVDKSLWTKMKDGLKGSALDRDLDEKIERYKSSMAALDEQVNYLHTSTTVTVKASVSGMTLKVINTEGIVIRTQGLAQAID